MLMKPFFKEAYFSMCDHDSYAERRPFCSFLPSVAIVFMFLLAIPLVAFGQAGNASISGLVSDPSGRVVHQAEVSIKNVATNVTAMTMTNQAGIYTFPSLPPGNYVLTVHKQGFRSVDLVDLTLYTQDRLERNFTLSVGSASESVTVTAGVTNESPAVSMTVDREFVANMPLNGESFQDLIQLAPGAVMSNNSGYYSIDGQRTDGNNYTVDGVSANLGGYNNSSSGTNGGGLSGSSPAQTVLGTTQALASVDSLQEFTIQTSSYAAEFGRSPGGQVQFTTRSGTNSLHGTLFDYLRNTDFDANSFSNDYYHDPQTAEHQNDFGGSFGGPLVIPHLYDGRNKTFFFLSYEGLRLLLPTSESEYTPTQALRNAANVNVLPFLNAASLPNEGPNSDGCTVVDPTTNQGAACDGLFYAGYSYPNRLDNYSARIDQNFGIRLHGFIRYADTPSSVSTGGEDANQRSTHVDSWTGGLTYMISRSLINEFRFNYSRDAEQSGLTQEPFHGSVPFPQSMVILPAYAGPNVELEGRIDGTTLGSLYDSSYNFSQTATVQHQYQVVDDLSFTTGKHSLKFGLDWRRLTSTFSSNADVQYLAFSSLSDILHGNVSTYENLSNLPGTPVFHNLSLYAQDHWKLNSRLTLDYGLRWDINPPPGPSNGKYPVTLTSTNLATAMLTDGANQPYATDYRSFGPRAGFTWRVFPELKRAIVVRGGFGIFFDTAQQEIGAAYAGVYPFQATGPLYSGVALPLSDAQLTPPTVGVALTTPYPNIQDIAIPNLASPYTEQWNFSVDKELNRRNNVTVSYVGNVGRDLIFTQTYSKFPTNPNFTSLNLTTNGAHSNYNALQVQDQGRIVSGLDIVGSFTWAHVLDNSSTDINTTGPIYGNSNFDLRRVLNVALNYESLAIGHERLLQAITRGWVLANRFSTQSGYPVTITESNVVLSNGSTIVYSPDLAPGVPIYLHGADASDSVSGWKLNRAAFACTTTGATNGACTGTPTREGTLGRNYVRNPPFWTLNSSVQRAFPIYEQFHFNFRVDAFNVFNHPNVYGPNTTLSSSTFGELSGSVSTIGSTNALYAMGAARSLQLSLKLQF
jgi:hypothetical protein